MFQCHSPKSSHPLPLSQSPGNNNPVYETAKETLMYRTVSCFFDDPADVGNLISGSSAFSKTSLNIWKFTIHILLKPGLENFEHYLLACEMSAIVR